MSDTNEPRRMPAKKPGQGQKPAGESKSDSPSMKERLLAERRAAEAAAAKPAPSAKPSPGAKPALAAKPAPAAKAADGGAKPAVKAAAGAARPTRATRAAAGDEGAAGARCGARAPREAKKKSPVPLIATGVLVVAAGVGGFILMQKGEEPVEAGGGKTETVAGGAPTGETDADATGAAEGAGASATDTGADAQGSAAPAAKAPSAPSEALDAAEAAALEGAKGLPSNKDPDSWNVIAITKNPDQINDPNSVDLTKLKPYGKPPGLDQAEWDTLVEDARLMFDGNSGAKGSRAQARLEKPGNLNAWPAIMNEFIKLDPRRPDDNVVGMRAQRVLHLIRGGSAETFAFDWRTPSESGGELERKDLYANLQLIVELHDVWRRHLAAPDRYFREKIAKGDVQAQLMGVEPEKDAGSDEELDLDDLDLSDLGGG